MFTNRWPSYLNIMSLLGENDSRLIVKNVTCIGAGYVGAITSVVLAYKCPNLHVTIVDESEEKIKAWLSNNIPIYEPKLKKFLNRVHGFNLDFSYDIKSVLKNSDLIFICVNTPTKTYGIGKGLALDMSFLEKAAYNIRDSCKKRECLLNQQKGGMNVINIRIYQILNSQIRTDTKFYILSNPEFLSEGNAIDNILYPDRVLIGGVESNKGVVAIQALKDIYLNWVDESKIITTNLWSAELSKLAANAFLAQRVSSINSVSAICEMTGANILDVSQAIGLDSRIGDKFLTPSLGFGGSCFNKDIFCLVYLCESLGLKEVAAYWHQVLEMNNYQRSRFVKNILLTMFDNIFDKVICIYGAAFKKNTSDIR
ncbi:hypothetical protein HZS_1316 [Henneguya salminicola]|nr:hypothetical protein HZS_1316 [Henneguya salminicola]